MNTTRVNLLTKSEQRHQGAISRRFLTISLVVTPIMLIAVLSGIKLVQYTGVKSVLESSRTVWANLEPKLELFKEEKRGLATNRQMIKLFDGWNGAQGSFVKLLEDIQETVPENIQFVRMSVRGTQADSVFAAPEDMAMDYKLVIEGISQGEHAENDVIQLRKELLACEQVGSTFNSLKLASLRKRNSPTGQNLREFRLEGEVEDVKGGEL
ncbi:hypothetical protein PDESU_03530 [Pontiella desulfatans]|uniref:Uncharacterized protein n=1 Tax=Pontiella desulfatans TaxID=2750659 RepID=A0A6C2U4P7_PONDE|nr:hypothetical protein [Pontiella desulfatans]VGO14950.1 hypothetical protein PDESU_03530 [Pontiella desulfatans]